MRTVILQMCPLMPSFEAALQQRFEVLQGFDDAAREAIVAARAAEIKAVVTGGHLGIPNALMDRLPALEIVGINGVGFDKVDLVHAKSRAVRVSNTPNVLTEDVADLAIGLIIALLRRIPQGDTHVRSGSWLKGDMPLARKASAQRYGILGLGRIGQAIAKRLSGFDVEIAYTDRTPLDVPYAFHDSAVSLAAAVDVLVIAAAAGPETAKLVNASVLDALGPKGVLVNVARGSIVDEDALVAALLEKRIAGAALDVFAAEPHVPAAMIGLDNVVLTPHIASGTVDTRESMAALVLANLDAHFEGREMPTALV